MVTYTLVVLVFVGAGAHLLRGLVVPPEQSDLAAYSEVFYKRAARQRINWFVGTRDAFEVARQRDVPVMVFAGDAASLAARRFDDEVFSDREVAARLNREYVCVRIDLRALPHWRAGHLQLTRAAVGADDGYAVWFFRPDGTLVTWVGRRTWDERPDNNDFLGRLNEVTEAWRTLPSEEWKRASRDQANEREALTSGLSRAVPDSSLLDFEKLDRLPFVQFRSELLEIMARHGKTSEAIQRLRSLITSPSFDLVEGGFFRQSSGANPMIVEFDKDALSNAKTTAALAKAYALTKDPLFEYAYKRTVENVLNRFLSNNTWSSYIACDVERDGRSKRNSLSPALLRTRFTPGARSRAEVMGLGARANSLAIPYLSNEGEALADRKGLDAFVSEARRATDESALNSPDDEWLDVSASAVARLIEGSLLSGDDDALRAAVSLSSSLQRFRVGEDDVVHTTRGSGAGTKVSSDYVAYSDAKLWEYFATADPDALLEGEKVLRRAIELFCADSAGAFRTATVDPKGFSGLDITAPQVVDAPLPGVGSFIRICALYGMVLLDDELIERAKSLCEFYGPIANALPERTLEILAASSIVAAAEARTVRANASTRQFSLVFAGDPFATTIRLAPIALLKRK